MKRLILLLILLSGSVVLCTSQKTVYWTHGLGEDAARYRNQLTSVYNGSAVNWSASNSLTAPLQT